MGTTAAVEEIHQSIGHLQASTEEHSRQITEVSASITRIHERIDTLIDLERSSNVIAQQNATKIDKLEQGHTTLTKKLDNVENNVAQARGGLSMLRWIFSIIVGSGLVAGAFKFFGSSHQ